MLSSPTALSTPGTGFPIVDRGLSIAGRRYLLFASLCFLLYTTVGKSFAYVGVHPVFVGEIFLAASIVFVIKQRQLSRLLSSTLGKLFFIFLAWEMFCTLPFVSIYKVDALRDAVLWGYSLFALASATFLLASPDALLCIERLYCRFCPIFLVIGVASAVAYALFKDRLPVIPGTEDVTIPYTKCTDLCIHLAGIVAFSMTGSFREARWWPALIVPGFLFALSQSRGGGFAFLCAAGVLLLLDPKPKRLLFVLGSLLAILALALTTDIRFRVGDQNREVSINQIIDNVASISGSSTSQSDLEGTKEWRLEWWRRIIDYTLNGPYFWTGKGYGVNLTLDDGISSDETEFPGLRSPHNSHLSILARSGVPGISMWMALHLLWAGTIFSTYLRAKRSGDDHRAALLAWLLSYWVAFVVNAAFDVALEGPVNAIPFWLLWGLGWGLTFLPLSDQNRSLARRHSLAPADLALTAL